MEILLAGVDEAGVGPLAGPVIAAAVILNPREHIHGIMDSKKLTAKKREALSIEIQNKSIAWAIGRADVEEIDHINILQASLLAMRRAISLLGVSPSKIVVDGKYCPPDLFCEVQAIIGGDESVQEISAASILAKVARDSEMKILDTVYPGYGFAAHKGYGTKYHLNALKNLGITPIHRRSFAPVKLYAIHE